MDGINLGGFGYVVPTGRVVVPTGRYVVPAGKVIIIVSPGRLNLVPTGRILSPGKVKESKARTTLLQSILDDHMADFHYMDDVRDIWNAVKARSSGNAESKKMRKSMLKQEFSEFRISEAEGLHKGYDRMQKILSQLNQLKAKPEDEDINLKFLRALPSSWSQVALTLKTKGGLKLFSIDDLYYKLKTLEKNWSSRGDGLKLQMACFPVRGHFARECRAKGGNDKQRYSSFKIQEIGKKEEDSKALITVDTLVDWTDHDGQSNGVIASKEFGMIAGCDTEDAIEEGAAKIYNLITGANTKEVSTAGDAGEFALMGVTSELGWDDSAFSVFTTNSKEVEGRPHFNRFAKTDSMKAVPPPLSRDYTPLSDHTNLDESQISYGTKSSTSGDSNSMSDDFVSCDNSDKSSEVNSNEFALQNSMVKNIRAAVKGFLPHVHLLPSIITSKSEAKMSARYCDALGRGDGIHGCVLLKEGVRSGRRWSSAVAGVSHESANFIGWTWGEGRNAGGSISAWECFAQSTLGVSIWSLAIGVSVHPVTFSSDSGGDVRSDMFYFGDVEYYVRGDFTWQSCCSDGAKSTTLNSILSGCVRYNVLTRMSVSLNAEHCNLWNIVRSHCSDPISVFIAILHKKLSNAVLQTYTRIGSYLLGAYHTRYDDEAEVLLLYTRVHPCALSLTSSQ
ncbi:hypothetical protein Tco_0128649 [Tanacetum coccineum]